MSRSGHFLCAVGMAVLCAVVPLAALTQAQEKKPDKPSGMAKLRIEVTAGEKNQPVDNASVYVKFNDPRTKKMVEMNLKSNRAGVANSPQIPAGKVLIQVIAEGWKTYGRWFDAEEGQQTLKVHLEKPPKWY
jgi:hypothetical protein